MSDSRVIIVHGSEGSPGSNWFPWLEDELGLLGTTCLVPQFPTPDGQSLNAWLEVLEREAGEFGQNDILIGHSTGVIFTLNVLNQLERPIKAAFLVAGFASQIGNEKYDNLNSTFLKPVLNWQKIRTNSKAFFVYAGDDDPYVPLDRGRSLAEFLGVEPLVIKGAGHINADSGYTQFATILNDISGLQ